MLTGLGAGSLFFIFHAVLGDDKDTPTSLNITEVIGSEYPTFAIGYKDIPAVSMIVWPVGLIPHVVFGVRYPDG